jgi:hypothetical protein
MAATDNDGMPEHLVRHHVTARALHGPHSLHPITLGGAEKAKSVDELREMSIELSEPIVPEEVLKEGPQQIPWGEPEGCCVFVHAYREFWSAVRESFTHRHAESVSHLVCDGRK